YLVSEDAPNKTILCAVAGAYAIAKIVETDGAWLKPDEQTPEGIAAHWAEITASAGEKAPQGGFEQTIKFTAKAAEGLGVSLD
ncbi:MAG: 3-oxoacyl-ACP reductase, partial [Halioglobus sp.]